MSVRVACLGAGYFSQFHYGSWARMSDVDIVGACDRDPEAAARTGYETFSDLSQMLAETQPDLLDIIVPPTAHAESIETALQAGIGWIICQKPFCTGLAEAQRITQAVEEAGATLIIHENFRFQPWYRTIRQALDQGRIGQHLQATFRLRPGDGQGPRAYLDRQPYFQTMERFLIHETAVHWIDTFRYLLGDPEAVYADLRRVNPVIAGEDAGFVLFDHPGGARALFDGNRLLDHNSDNTRRTMGEALFEGTDGVLTLLGDGSVTLRAFGGRNTSELLGPDRWEGFGGDCVHALQRHVIAALTGDGPVENAARHYLKVIAIEEAVYTSARDGIKVRLDG